MRLGAGVNMRWGDRDRCQAVVSSALVTHLPLPSSTSR